MRVMKEKNKYGEGKQRKGKEKRSVKTRAREILHGGKGKHEDAGEKRT